MGRVYSKIKKCSQSEPLKKAEAVVNARKKSLSINQALKKYESDIDEIIEMLEVAEDHVLSLKKQMAELLELINESTD